MHMFGPKQERECTPLHDRSPFLARGLHADEGPTPFEQRASEAEAAEDAGGVDLMIQGLVDRLPKSDSTWSLEERARWLRTAASIFGLVYKTRDGEHGEIGVVLAKDGEAGKPTAWQPAID